MSETSSAAPTPGAPTGGQNNADQQASRRSDHEPAGSGHGAPLGRAAPEAGEAYHLGVLLATRLDPPDLDVGRLWYQMASDAGNNEAINLLGNLLM